MKRTYLSRLNVSTKNNINFSSTENIELARRKQQLIQKKLTENLKEGYYKLSR
jgi:hypothetical protein